VQLAGVSCEFPETGIADLKQINMGVDHKRMLALHEVS
jgi:hypothetical protein